MPQLALSAASFTAAAAPAVAATAAKVGFMTSLKSVAVNLLMNAAITAAMSALQPQVGAAGRPGEWLLSPDGPIPFAAGRVGVAGSAVHIDTFGPDLMYKGFVTVLSGAGPIDGFETFRGDDEFVSFDASGKAISSQWKGEMWLKRSLGAQPDAALTSPAGLKHNATLPGWTGSSRLSGKACDMLILGENSKGSAYPTGEVKPLRVFRGLRVWDPRLDSTYPGGVGPCRLGDPSTWVYSANPGLWAIKWSLGLWEGPVGKGAPQVDRQVGGIGAKASGIEFETLVALANIADANGWTCAAYPTTDDDKSQVLDAFLQAAGAIYAQRAGKISCIQRAAPRTSIVTISVADTAGPLEIDTAASRIDRINTIRPRFWSEPHRWQLTALKEVTAEAYQVEDGGERPRGIDYPYVTNAKQAAQLAALQIAHTREGIAGVIPLKPHLQRIRPGDAFTITEPGFVLNGVKCLCLNTEYDPATGIVRVSFVSETDAKYPFAMGQNPTPPVPPVLTPVDPTLVSPPLPEDWVIVPRPPAPDGTQVPGFDLTGIVSNATATAVIVEWGLPPDPPPPDPIPEAPEGERQPVWADWVSWTQVYQGPPNVERIPIDGLQPGQIYYVAVRNQRGQNFSERGVWGPYVAPDLIAGGLSDAAAQALLDDALAAVDDKVKEAAEEIEKAIDLDDLFHGQDDIAESILKLGRGLLDVRSLLDRLARIDGLPAGVAVKQEVRVLEEADRLEAEARTQMSAVLGDSIAAAEQSISVVATNLYAESQARLNLGVQVGQNKSAAEALISSVATDLSAESQARLNLAVQVGQNKSAAESLIGVVATDLSVEAQARLLLAGRVGVAEGAIVDERALRISGDQAEGAARTALALVVNDNKASGEQAISGVVTDLAAEIQARLNLGVRVTNAEGAIIAESTARANQDGVWLQNFNLLGARRGNGSGWVLNKSTVDITDEGTLAAVLSGLRAADGSNSSSITTLQTASGTHASQLTTLTNTTNGHTSSISSLFDVTNGLGARWTLSLDVNNRITGLVADGATRSVVFNAANFSVIDDGNGLSYQPATGRLKVTKGSKKTVIGAGSNLIIWAGNTTVADGSETVDNGDLGIGTGDAWFGGRTLSGPFDTGAASATAIALPKNAWTTVASLTRTMSTTGAMMARLLFDVNLTGAPGGDDDFAVQYRLVVTDTNGSNLVVVGGSFGVFPTNVWTPVAGAAGVLVENYALNLATRGSKRIVLQVNPTGANISTAQARNGRSRGLYGA